MGTIYAIWEWFLKQPARFFLLAAVVVAPILKYFDSRDYQFNFHDILVEGHGLLFDLFVFGVLLSVYEALRVRKELIRKHQDEIDDFRLWDEKEAAYRIIGAVKRLNREGQKHLNLSYCFLCNVSFEGLNLEGANLQNAKLKDADLRGVISLKNADFRNADLLGAKVAPTFFQDLRGWGVWGADEIEKNYEIQDGTLTYGGPFILNLNL